MRCSEVRKTTLDIYFTFTGQLLLVNYAFSYHAIDPAFWFFLQTVIDDLKLHEKEDPEKVLREMLVSIQPQISPGIRLLYVANQP
jgi:hypothetical protein